MNFSSLSTALSKSVHCKQIAHNVLGFLCWRWTGKWWLVRWLTGGFFMKVIANQLENYFNHRQYFILATLSKFVTHEIFKRNCFGDFLKLWYFYYLLVKLLQNRASEVTENIRSFPYIFFIKRKKNNINKDESWDSINIKKLLLIFWISNKNWTKYL